MDYRSIARFGPAGNEDGFYEKGNKATEQAPLYLAQMGLNAYEYQGGRGIKISSAKAAEIGKKAKEHDIALSIHAPYYISLSSTDEAKRLGSVRYVFESAVAAAAMGADRIIMHSGSCGTLPREHALLLAKDTLSHVVSTLASEGFGELTLCIETMGKINQLGTLDEVLELCTVSEKLVPCIDFGHINARTMGGIQTKEDYEDIIKSIINKLGYDRSASLHCHFSKIEYTTGGEKRHLTFEDTLFGPDFEPLAEIFVKYNIYPTMICESRGTQAKDALYMKQCYEKANSK